MNFNKMIIACVVQLAFSGCATVTTNEMQSLTLNTTTTDGLVIDQASCTLKNDKGAWELISPGTVAVRRSDKDLTVECKKEGVADGFLIATSRFSNIFVNLLFGHGIGTTIDHYSGKAYDYPDDLPVKMGASVTVDKRQKQPASAQTTAPDASQKN